MTPRRLGSAPSRSDRGARRLGAATASTEALGGNGGFSRADLPEGAQRALFGLATGGAYQALVYLLVELRKPQLSRSLDEKGQDRTASSEALCLADVGEIIGPVAEAFRGLEQEPLHLERYTAADRSVRAFMREYRRYAAIPGFAPRRRHVTAGHSQ